MLSKLLYFLVLKPISLLPLWWIHRLSDFLFLVIYHIVGYRRKVVRKNLKLGLSERSKKERKVIEKKFYRHLCDLILEAIQNFSIDKRTAIRRVRITNPEILEDNFRGGKNVILYSGHYGNWESLAVSINQQLKHQPTLIVAPISNKYIEEKMYQTRGKYGAWQTLIRESLRFVVKNKGERMVLVILGDQAPPNNKMDLLWTTFLGQKDTPVMLGAEKFAKKFGSPVYYFELKKTKRSHYEMKMELVIEDARETEKYEVTKMLTQRLEKTIRRKPEYWLWSHKRWKRKKPH